MSFSFRDAAVCASLGVLLSTSAFARGPAVLPSNVSIIPVGASVPFVDIDLAGWTSWGGFGAANNTTVGLDVGVGTQVTGFSFSNLSFSTNGGSYLSELTLSVNATNGNPAADYLDWSPSTVGASGSAGPLAGSWGGAVGGPGPFGPGSVFSVEDGLIFVTVYEGFDDPFGDNGSVLDATISAGTLRVFLAPVPEPGTYGMMALGLLAVGAVMRKRQQSH